MAAGDAFDPYRVLGLGRGASLTEVARAYRALAKEAHPDLHGPGASGRMQDLNRAFRILSDPGRRRAWDEAHAMAPSRPHWSVPARPGRAADADPVPSTGWHTTMSPPGPSGADVAGRPTVRPHDGWPRASPAPTDAGGVRDSAWLAIGVGAALVVAVIVVGALAAGSSLAGSARQALNRGGAAPTSVVAIDPDREVAVYLRAGERLGLVVAERGADGWQLRDLTEVASPHSLSVILFIDDDPTAPLPAIVFGRAEDVYEVRVAAVSVGPVAPSAGTWLMAVPGVNDPGDLDWEFWMVDGSVVRGSGELGR